MSHEIEIAGSGGEVDCYSSQVSESGAGYYRCGTCEWIDNAKGTGSTRVCTVDGGCGC